MPDRDLPARPNVEQYKKQSKELLKAVRAGDAAGAERMRKHHPNAHKQHPSLADAQLVIALEHGFPSWARFVERIQEVRITSWLDTIVDPVAAFLVAASVPRGTWHAAGTLDEANAILARYPDAARADIYTAAVLGDEARLRELVAGNAALVRTPGGPHAWEPLTYLCFSRYLRLDASRAEAFTRCAHLLLELGADANGGWWEAPDHEGGKPTWESVLYGAAGLAQHGGVTRELLQFGADPNDGETPYHAPETYDNTVLRILLESGKVDERGKAWILGRKADWHDDAGMNLALEHGADPNYIPHWGRGALHHSIQRGNGLVMIEMLLDAGADPLLPNNIDGRTAAEMGARGGRGDILRLLASRGIDPNLTGADRLIAACAMADREAITALTTADPAPARVALEGWRRVDRAIRRDRKYGWR